VGFEGLGVEEDFGEAFGVGGELVVFGFGVAFGDEDYVDTVAGRAGMGDGVDAVAGVGGFFDYVDVGGVDVCAVDRGEDVLAVAGFEDEEDGFAGEWDEDGGVVCLGDAFAGGGGGFVFGEDAAEAAGEDEGVGCDVVDFGLVWAVVEVVDKLVGVGRPGGDAVELVEGDGFAGAVAGVEVVDAEGGVFEVGVEGDAGGEGGCADGEEDGRER